MWILFSDVIQKLIQECLLERYSQRTQIEDEKLNILALVREEYLFAENIKENLEEFLFQLVSLTCGRCAPLDFAETSIFPNLVFHLKVDEFENDEHQPVQLLRHDLARVPILVCYLHVVDFDFGVNFEQFLQHDGEYFGKDGGISYCQLQCVCEEYLVKLFSLNSVRIAFGDNITQVRLVQWVHLRDFGN